MTPSEIAARNRANAKKSTGPRSAQGRAVVAQNALRHGATAQPDPDSVAAWLRIILGQPDVSPGDLLTQGERGFRALALAESEARLARTARALCDFEAGRSGPSEAVRELDGYVEDILDLLEDSDTTARQWRSGQSLIRRLKRSQNTEMRPGGRHHRLLKRYYGEARAHRKRAFLDWLAWLADSGVAPIT